MAKSKALRADPAPLGGRISAFGSPLSPPNPTRTPSQIPAISRSKGAGR